MSDTTPDNSRGELPLTRQDVEQLMTQVRPTPRLNLNNRNLSGIDLHDFDLSVTDLHMANLRGANLRGANLNGSNLSRADLRGADLRGATLRGATLNWTNLAEANLSEVKLDQTDLRWASLRGANLSGANLQRGYLPEADLGGANLRGADLSGARLHRVNLAQADLTGAELGTPEDAQLELLGPKLDGAIFKGVQLAQKTMPARLNRLLRVKGVTGLDVPATDEYEYKSGAETMGTSIRFHIVEEPLTLPNLTTVLTALTELATKCLLIAQGRVADVLNYAQTRDVRFAQEAHIVVSRMTQNSPLAVTVDVSATNVADAIVSIIDGFRQAKERKELKDLEVKQKQQDLVLAEREAKLREQEKSQQIEQADRQFDLEQVRQRLEIDKERLAVDKERVALLLQQVDLLQKLSEFALQLAGTAVGKLQSSQDEQVTAMLKQALVGNIQQLLNADGLIIAE